jgi:K+/H+ antiporter YhaU regulatory subunit KhtT
LHIEDVELEVGSMLVDTTLASSAIRSRSQALVVAIREPDGEFINSPKAEHRLRAGSHLIVVGDGESVRAVRDLASTKRPPLF